MFTISVALNTVGLKSDCVYLFLFHHTFSYPFLVPSFHILFTRIYQLCTDLGGLPLKKEGDIFWVLMKEKPAENPVKLGQPSFCLYLSFGSPIFIIVSHLASIWPK